MMLPVRAARLRRRCLLATVAATAVTLAVLPATSATAKGASSTPTTAPAAPTVVSVDDLGHSIQNPDVIGRDGNESTLFDGKSVWGFSDTPLTVPNNHGKNWDDNSMAWTTDLNGADGLDLNHDIADSSGVPIEFLPHTPGELKFNQEHAGSGTHCEVQPCGLEDSLWNGPLVTDTAANQMLSFYGLLVRPVQNGWKTLGTGLAVISADGTVTRPIAHPGAAYPTLLFQGDKWGANAALTVGNDLYLYLCQGGFLVENCLLARAPMATATQRQAWTFYTADGTWSPKLKDGVVVANGGAAGSDVTWDPGLNEYLLTYMPPESNNVVAQVSPNLWGPWSPATTLFTAATPAAGDVDYAGWAHPEFASDNGLTQYIAYYHPLGGLNAETRWVQVTFAPPPE
jgi:hypothetical protein